jgi:hypothetical protein
MLKDATYEILDSLAANYIPDGRHRILHTDNRKAWTSLIADMLERGCIRFKIAHLVEYAKNWEVVLESRLSILN